MASLVRKDNASDFCDKHTTLTDLKVHVKWVFEQNNKCFKCSVCSKAFYKLKRHTRVRHKGGTDFKCSQFSYESVYSSSIKYHGRRCHPQVKESS